jgi:predicted Rossmann-fold nucleotide-binding protein
MDCGKEVGRLLAERGIDLVYGGGSAGLMGQVARSRGDEAGSVTGITLDFECWSTGEKNEIVAKNMFDRK